MIDNDLIFKLVSDNQGIWNEKLVRVLESSKKEMNRFKDNKFHKEHMFIQRYHNKVRWFTKVYAEANDIPRSVVKNPKLKARRDAKKVLSKEDKIDKSIADQMKMFNKFWTRPGLA